MLSDGQITGEYGQSVEPEVASTAESPCIPLNVDRMTDDREVERRQRSRGRGELHSKLEEDSGHTTLAHLYQQGCAKIRLPSRSGPELDAVTINTAGGLTGGDKLEWHVTAAPGTHVRVSSAACEKVYRTHGPSASVENRLTVAANARIDWLPQETILFDNAALVRRLHVDLETTSRALLVEPLLLGRAGMGETVQRSHFKDDWRIYRDGRLLHAEALCLQGDISALADRAALLAGHVAMASVLYCGPEQEEALTLLASRINELALADAPTTCMAASVLPHRVVVRLLARDGLALRKRLLPCIDVLNGGCPLPRVWMV